MVGWQEGNPSCYTDTHLLMVFIPLGVLPATTVPTEVWVGSSSNLWREIEIFKVCLMILMRCFSTFLVLCCYIDGILYLLLCYNSLISRWYCVDIVLISSIALIQHWYCVLRWYIALISCIALISHWHRGIYRNDIALLLCIALRSRRYRVDTQIKIFPNKRSSK